MLSPRSRGKGNRRPPVPSSRRRQKKIEWRNRAPHAVGDASELPGELVEAIYRCPFGRSAAESIYLFDQRVAGTGLRYYAELGGTQFGPVFTIRVPADSAAKVRAIIAQVEER
jgi:hypothetical protein